MLRHVANVSRGIYPQEKCDGAKRCERDTREGIVSGVCARMHACVRVCAGQVRSRALNWETGTLVEKGGEGEERERGYQAQVQNRVSLERANSYFNKDKDNEPDFIHPSI